MKKIMFKQTFEALTLLENTKEIEKMNACLTWMGKYGVLYTFIEKEILIKKAISDWDITFQSQVVEILRNEYKMNLPICPQFAIDLYANKQWCLSSRAQCLCCPPQMHLCIWKQWNNQKPLLKFIMSRSENGFPRPVCHYFIVENNQTFCTITKLKCLCYGVAEYCFWKEQSIERVSA